MFVRFLAIIFITLLPFSAPMAQSSDKNLPIEDKITAEELYKVQPGDIMIGDKNAPVTIIEYASMSCSHCASFHNDTFDDIKTKYIDSGKVRFLFRDFPLDEPALRGAMMARCAGRDGNEKFMKFTKVMFSTQSNWAPKKNYLEVLANIGKLGGMSGSDFELCIADKDLERSIMESKFNASRKLEVRSTPTLFINRVMHKGAKSFEYYSNIIDGLLGEGKTPAVSE